ncbi:ectoine/hydroxyectoine ABC transporter substrate-binding protein EhuB [Rhizobium sp. TRM95796]|uniref:ectoine/hydroxyectoine ABC transporter substrate-binding protein EhuB n=1 Tax=Rhizobium sp. TRM95796 TaxID=2979862 RepID=UPI0021E839F4|nr:ectoine/hydroxyectoine ABC transporter substrate-binding protein EhuB [Rhizobium sp. TRM95796]MCV3768126.1 ectoine/hydroxyectoine ABC transporter substrate-binding protein EhuB [Rhizobium sp. TRM95796]
MNKFTRRIATSLAAFSLLGLAGLPSTSAAKTIEEAVADGKLTVGIHNRAPWGFRGPDGLVTGFHPDLVRAAFEPLGVKQIDFVISDFGALIPGLNANRFDMIASGISITPERCGQVVFSEPDLSVLDGLIVKKGNPKNIHSYADIAKNPDIKLSGGRGSLNTKNALDAGVPTDQVLQLTDAQATLAAILSGRADAATISAPSAQALLADPNLAGLERAMPFKGLLKADGSEAAMYTAVAFRSKDKDLRDAYNKQLAKMIADGTVRKIMSKYGFADSDMAPSKTTLDICAGK